MNYRFHITVCKQMIVYYLKKKTTIENGKCDYD